LSRNPDVVEAGMPPLLHYLTKGAQEGRSYFPIPAAPASTQIAIESSSVANSEWAPTYSKFQDRVKRQRQEMKDAVKVAPLKIFHLDDPLEHLASLSLPRYDVPKVSILIPAYNEAKFTAECIASILASAPNVTYEVIIADDASPEASAQALAHIENVIFIRQPINLGFLKNCNTSLRYCKGQYLFLLNNDAQLRAGALDSLVAILDGDSGAAAAGPKLLYPNGRLQEAGCSVNRNGISRMAGLFADPSNPAFSFNRDVHYCSGAALLIRRSEIGVSLFDELYTPAYCEDLDLCMTLLSKGRRIVYCSDAEVVHHLSISTNRQSVRKRLQLVARNQQRLMNKWSTMLDDMNTVRTIAFYLPQYHPTPENNFYWGQGFTEWTNVTKATPAYDGHYQPHLPSDLGFYDLRVKRVMEDQAALAKRYGIAGFCVYYYNFGRQRALDKAFEAMVSDSSIDFPYCVCWANESWTRHWDGGSRGIIFEQTYDQETLSSIVGDAIRYAADPRYIRINSKPLFLVYRPLLIPDVRQFTQVCRSKFREAGFRDVYLAYVESMEAADKRPHPADLGFDACVEFPPQGIAVPADNSAGSIRKTGFIGNRYDYEATVLQSINRPTVSYKRHPSVFPSWDNTPRQPLRGDSFVGATPEVFQVFVEEKLEEVTQNFVGEERLLFVNAWNEWAEGTHLEPDQKFGHRWLEAIRNALMTKSLA
jgi:O-antigen biosynthesis protein